MRSDRSASRRKTGPPRFSMCPVALTTKIWPRPKPAWSASGRALAPLQLLAHRFGEQLDAGLDAVGWDRRDAKTEIVGGSRLAEEMDGAGFDHHALLQRFLFDCIHVELLRSPDPQGRSAGRQIDSEFRQMFD